MINPAKCDSVKNGLYAAEVEKRFCKAYGNVISNFFDFKEDIILGAKEILNSKKERKKLNCDLPSYQLGFFLSFSVQDTCLSARKFYESVMNNPKIIEKLSKNSPIKLLCLESESLPTVIGVCQAINDIVKKIGSKSKLNFTEIRILVIDNRENWKRLCSHVIDIANSYFTKIELKLDSVEDFVSWSFQEFNDRIRGLDFFVIARFFAEGRTFNYNLIRIVLNEMKEDAILFYFDSCNKKFYDSLKEISTMHSFIQVKNCLNLQASFEDLGDEEYHLDLPVSWDKDFQPVMFSTWIKDFAVENGFSQEEVKPVVSNELNPIKSKRKSNNLETLTLNKDVPNSKSTETSTNEQTDIISRKKKINHITKQCNGFDTSCERVNLVNVKGKSKSSKMHLEQSNCSKGQKNASSGTKKVKTLSKFWNQFNSPFNQIDVVSEKKKVKSSEKNSYPSSANEKKKTGAVKVKKESKAQKTHEMLADIISVLNESSLTSQCSNVLCDAGIPEKVIAKAENRVNSVKRQGCESSISCTSQIVNFKESSTLKISASTSKTIATNKVDEAIVTKKTLKGNVSIPVSQKQNESKSSDKSAEKNTISNPLDLVEEFITTSINNESPITITPGVQTQSSFRSNLPKKSSKANTARTKKSNKSIATEKIKLNGKFARMDLEKKNKDERHKMRAKKASFAKHANFDYDD